MKVVCVVYEFILYIRGISNKKLAVQLAVMGVGVYVEYINRGCIHIRWIWCRRLLLLYSI